MGQIVGRWKPRIEQKRYRCPDCGRSVSEEVHEDCRIEVCENCKRACCLMGVYKCGAPGEAVRYPRSYLLDGKREHEDFLTLEWSEVFG
jgi:transposase-like protein